MIVAYLIQREPDRGGVGRVHTITTCDEREAWRFVERGYRVTPLVLGEELRIERRAHAE